MDTNWGYNVCFIKIRTKLSSSKYTTEFSTIFDETDVTLRPVNDVIEGSTQEASMGAS